MSDPVVITGSGLTCSLGNNVDEVWRRLCSTESGIRRLQAQAPGFEGYQAAVVEGLDPAGLGIHQRDARIMRKHSHMLIAASRGAYASAQIEGSSIAPEEIGFFAGMGMVDYAVEDLISSVEKALKEDGSIDYNAFFSSAYREIHPLWPLSMLNNISFCQAAIGLIVKGENTVFSPHADSGAMAIAEGARTLMENKAAVVLAGGVSEPVSPESLSRAFLAGILCSRMDVTDPCRPFSDDRTGTVLGEGSGIIAMELKSAADRRGASYDTVISGYGFTCGRTEFGSAPSKEAIAASMTHAIETAELRPSDVDLVIAHGDGTIQGDENEAAAIKQVFSGIDIQPVLYYSKPAIGHLLSGAAAVDTILGSLMLSHQRIPAIPGIYGQTGAAALPLQRILVNALSYEGQCSSILIEKAVRQ